MRATANPVAITLTAALVASSISAQEEMRFRSGIDLISVTATVTDDDGDFVSGLRKEDFTVYEDGETQEITYFSDERVPVSLGIALDTSGSMTPDKMSAARSAIDRLVNDLLAQGDELFYMQFATRPDLVQEWTTDRKQINRAVGRSYQAGGTALYDAIAEALPIAQTGRNPRKALLVISDGNDTSSETLVGELRQLIRESEVLVYALGVDGTERTSRRRRSTLRLPLPQIQLPFPTPGRRPQPRMPFPPPIGGGGGGVWSRPGSERVNAGALRQITDETGGRTEIIRAFGDLGDATARIASELSRQYSLGYASLGKKDGKWHSIKVEPRDRRLNVRARRGYIAS